MKEKIPSTKDAIRLTLHEKEGLRLGTWHKNVNVLKKNYKMEIYRDLFKISTFKTKKIKLFIMV
jgi:hypothetical protein